MEKLTPEYPTDALAAALEVSESGFAAHRRKALRPRRQHDEQLRPLMRESFEPSRHTDGCLRVRLDLQDSGQRCGKNRVARLMRESGLRPRQKRRFRPRTTESRHDHAVAENWLSKVPTPDRPGLVWKSDLTYIETGEGWLSLAFTLDGCTRRCVAHHCRPDMRGELTPTTLGLAVQRQPPPPTQIPRLPLTSRPPSRIKCSPKQKQLTSTATNSPSRAFEERSTALFSTKAHDRL